MEFWHTLLYRLQCRLMRVKMKSPKGVISALLLYNHVPWALNFKTPMDGRCRSLLPTRLRGALTFPNRRRLLLMLTMERLPHLVALAISEAVSDLLNIMCWIILSFKRGSLGAMLRRQRMLMEGTFGREQLKTKGVRGSICSPLLAPLLSEQVK
jgi:hypothetical protein